MKKVCEQCPMPNKSKEICIKRRCKNADMPPPPPIESIPESKWHFEEGDIIGDNEIKIEILYIDKYKWEYFDAKVIELKDPDKDCGHYGSYVSKDMYYRFTLHKNWEGGVPPEEELLWEVYEEGTDRFHREGSTGAQFLLYWFDDQGFGFDLDS
jgi:hypothetical protein